MNHKPFFTIITASFNNAGSIRNTLDSVAAQTFQSLEHIVIDGGSTDETAFLLKSYESKYNLKWISEPDDGIADAMNKGVRQAQGEYIIFIHSDDTLYRNDSLLTAYEIIKDSFHSIYSFRIEHRFSEYQKKVINPPRFLWWTRFRNNLPHQGIFVHESIFKKTGLFNPDYTICMDYDHFYRAFNDGASLKAVREIISVMGGGGVSSNEKMNGVRLKEGFKIQMKNENNNLWKILQIIFSLFYFPYKLTLIPLIRRL